jgi:hypothetical protein
MYIHNRVQIYILFFECKCFKEKIAKKCCFLFAVRRNSPAHPDNEWVCLIRNEACEPRQRMGLYDKK